MLHEFCMQLLLKEMMIDYKKFLFFKFFKTSCYYNIHFKIIIIVNLKMNMILTENIWLMKWLNLLKHIISPSYNFSNK